MPLAAPPRISEVALGPCIRQCCYRVGPEVENRFRGAGHPVQELFSEDRLDLVTANRGQLEEMGVSKVIDSNQCTACRTDLFYILPPGKDEAAYVDPGRLSGRRCALAIPTPRFLLSTRSRALEMSGRPGLSALLMLHSIKPMVFVASAAGGPVCGVAPVRQSRASTRRRAWNPGTSRSQ